MKDISELTLHEREVIIKLTEAWNSFVGLPCEHQDDTTDFRNGICLLQRQIMARPIRRVLRNEASKEK